MSEGSIVIEILGDASDFTAKVEGLGAKTQSALSSVSSSLTAWGTGLTAAVTLPLGAAGAKAMQWALTTASAAEQADIAFSTMLGPERAKQMIADLTEFAKKTPFEMSGLTDATQKLLAYGFAADDVIPTLRAIGDATAALGSGQEGIDACTRAIGQMQAKGKVMSEEMLQLTEQGIPAWKYLAEALGTDVAGAQEMVTKGSVDAATGIAALKAGMEGDFGGLMAEQSKTLSGALSNLGDAAEATIKEIYKTDAYKELASAVADLADPVGDLVGNLMPALEGALSAASGAVAGLSSAISSLDASQVQAIVDAVGLLAGLGPALLVAGRAVGSAGDALGAASAAAGAASKGLDAAKTAFAESGVTAESVAAGAKKAFEGLKFGAGEAGAAIRLGLEDPLHAAEAVAGSAASGIRESFGTVPRAMSTVGGASQAVLGIFERSVPIALGVARGFGVATVVAGALAVALGGAAVAGQAMGVDMSAALSGFAGSLGNLAPLVESAFGSIAQAAPQAAAALSGQAPAIASAFGQLLSSAVQGLEAAMPGLVEAASAAATVLSGTLATCAPLLLEGAMQLFAGLLDALSETAGSLAQSAPELIGGLAESFAASAPTLLGAAGNLFMAIAQALPQVLPALVAALPVVIGGLTSSLPTFIGQVLAAAVNLFLGIARALPQVLPSAISALASLIGSVVSYIPTLIGQITAAALSLFLGIAHAVPQTVGSLLGAIGDLLGQAKEAFSSFSLVDVGRQMIQGFISGIQSAVGGLVDAAAGAASSALEAAKNLLGIHSPSRVFRNEVGRMVPLGAALGIDDEADAWRRSVDDAFGYMPKVSLPAATLGSVPLPVQPGVSAAYAEAARSASPSESEGRLMEEVGRRIDAAAERIERALGEPVSLSVDRREAGKIVRGLVGA